MIGLGLGHMPTACADAGTAVQLVDSCRTKLRGPGSEEQRMKRLENWLRARMHSYSVIRMVKTFLVQDAAEGV